MSYSNQANRLMGLVKNLENRYNKNEILYNDAVNLIKKYHSDIDQLASNAKVKHVNKKLAKLNLAVVKQNGTVNFPVRVWNKYLDAAEQAVQKAINKPTPQNITVAQNKINDVTNNQKKIENIVNKPNNGPKNIVPVPKPNNKPVNLPKGCDKFGFSALPNRPAIMKAFANIARSNHSNKGGMGKINMNELKRCRDEAIAKLPTKPPNKPKNIVPVPNKPPNKPKNIVPVPNKPKINTSSLKSRIRPKNGMGAGNKFRGLVSQVKAQKPIGAGNKFRGLVSQAKAQLPAAPKLPNKKVVSPSVAPPTKPAMSLANQLKAKRNGLKKTGNMAANRFRKNIPRASNRFRGAVRQVKAQLPAAPKPPNKKVMARAPRPVAKPTMSLANQLKAKKGGLKKTGNMAANRFRKNVIRPSNRFRGAVGQIKAQKPGASANKFRGVVSQAKAQLPSAPRPAMSLASQIAAQKRGLRPVGARAAPKFRQNMGRGGAAKFRGAVRGAQAARRFR